ncbi:transposase [Caballeronia sp. LjRoot31]|uniref:transposase n=1 Tax=Caballeronia sp. LjRoot31 TaxID=3342324 RepID=UPI003ECD4D6B
MDNYGTHKTPTARAWFAHHPRFHIHFTPTSASWLNQVEPWFATLTVKQIRCGTHRSTRQLEGAIRRYLVVRFFGNRCGHDLLFLLGGNHKSIRSNIPHFRLDETCPTRMLLSHTDLRRALSIARKEFLLRSVRIRHIIRLHV